MIKKANESEGLGLTEKNFAQILEKINPDCDNLKKFKEGLENDLATPVALAAMQVESNGKGQRKASESLAAIYQMDKVLSLDVIKNGFKVIEEEEKANLNAHAGDPEADEIDALVAERTLAKKNKDWAKADEIRNKLTERGIVIIDTPNGPTWKRQ